MIEKMELTLIMMTLLHCIMVLFALHCRPCARPHLFDELALISNESILFILRKQ